MRSKRDAERISGNTRGLASTRSQRRFSIRAAGPRWADNAERHCSMIRQTARLHGPENVSRKVERIKPSLGSQFLAPRRAGNRLGELMRAARRRASISQLELALRMNVSQRHVAFVEGGRSRPSRDLLKNWMSEAEAPMWLRNAAMLQAGFAPLEEERASQLQSSIDAMEILRLQDPNPAFIFNPDWRIAGMNQSGQILCRILMPRLLDATGPTASGMDMIAAVQDEDGLLSRAFWPSWSRKRRCPRILPIGSQHSHGSMSRVLARRMYPSATRATP
jgi:transcriptional regulator with XRE-family HTH domain